MSRFLLDTHIWIWQLRGSERQPRAVRKLIEDFLESCWLSPISLWETALLARRGRIELHEEFALWQKRAFAKMPLNEAPLNFEVALKSQEIQLSHRDPADHFLAATALVYDLVLVTVDERLTSTDWLPTYSG